MIRKFTRNSTAAFIAVVLVFVVSMTDATTFDSEPESHNDNPMASISDQYQNELTIVSDDVCVEGFPCVIGLRFSTKNHPKEVYLRDFSSRFQQSSGFSCLLNEESSDSAFRLRGWPDPSGRSEWDAGFDAPDPRILAPGESTVMWFDLAQLVVPPPSGDVEAMNSYPLSGEFPRAGVVEIVCKRVGDVSPPATATIRVRAATAAERTAIEDLSTDGIGRSWFPDTTFVVDEVAATSSLPTESQRIAVMIGVFRKALIDPNDGLVFLSSYSREYWGPFAELIAMIEYECLIETKRYTEAEEMKQQSPDGWVEVFRAVDQGDGLLQRLRRVRDGEVDYNAKMEKRSLERTLSEISNGNGATN